MAGALHTRLGVGVVLVVLMALSLAGKLVNQFGFFVYPDSYYYLLQATSMVTGAKTLGPGGLPFPPAGYAAMKVTYPAAVAGLFALGVPAETAGRAITVGAAVLSVAAAYWAVRRILDDRGAALLAAVFVALSYSLTYWAGIVLSDSISVLLAFVLLALAARARPDELGNAGDLATGAVLALLLLSRPTYAVALPMLAWLGVRRFAWGRRRFSTAAVAAALVASVVAFLYFPPAGFSAGVLWRLAPVIGVALAASVALIWLLRRNQPAEKGGPGGERGASRQGAVAYLVLAFAIPALALVAWLVPIVSSADPSRALANFAMRDVPLLIALVPGAVALRRGRRADVGVALMASAVVLLGVYVWVERRESRYLLHLLPLLVPVAAASVAMLPRMFARGRRLLADGRMLARLAFGSALVVALVWQVNTTFNRNVPDFLRTCYPREVARGLDSLVGERDILLTAAPWPYHFYLGNPAWGAGVAFSSRFGEYVSADTSLTVIDDAALRLHYPLLAAVLEAGAGEETAHFEVPVGYQYGYTSIADASPVIVYRVRADELQEAMVRQGIPLDDPDLIAPKGDQPR